MATKSASVAADVDRKAELESKLFTKKAGKAAGMLLSHPFVMSCHVALLVCVDWCW
jgi:hypothetical protein